MALRVWLPLNGTLENKGISNFSIAGTPTYYASGKLGQAFKCQGSTNIDFTVPELVGVKKYSICLWIYMESQSAQNGNWLACFRAYTQSGTIFYCSGTPSNSTNVVIFANNEKDMWSGNMSRAILDGWHHTTITSDGSKVILYIDGVEVQSNITANDGSLTGRIMLLNGSYAYLNDLRIYDHALSPLEVKEISQGLVLHYKLDGWSGGVGENLAYGTNTASTSTNTWRLSLQAGGTTNSIEYEDNIPIAVITRNDVEWTGWSYLHYDNIHPAEIKPSATYTISFDIKTSVDGTISFTGLCQGNATNYKTKSTSVIQGNCVANTWSHIILQCVTKDDFTDLNDSQVIYLNCSTPLKATGVTLKMKNMKMELGDIATPYSQAPEDLGIDTSIITDSSGYGNDGTVTGTFNINNDSNRYNYYLSSPNGTDNIKSSLSFSDIQTFTCSFWVKPSSSNGGYSIIASNYNAPSSGFWIATNCEGHAVWFYNGAYADTTTASLTNDAWHHCVVVCNDKTFSIYIDGIVQSLNRTTSSSKTINITNLSIFNSYTGSSWNTKRYGGISDFRFYTTALSAEDIAILYHTPTQIDNLGGLHTFELEEKNGNVFAGSFLNGTMTYDATNKYYVITSNTSTSTWGIGPAVGTSPKKLIPWGMSYRLTFEVYTPTAATWYIDYNNNDVNTTLSGNDNDTGRIATGIAVPANQWTLITYGCSNTNETKNPNHLTLYDYSTGLGPVMTNITEPITWYMRNPQWYLVDTDNSTSYQAKKNGQFKGNFFKQDNLLDRASWRNNEKAIWATEFIEK